MSRDYILEPFKREVALQIDYAKELNEQQYAAVTAPPGPALVIAGAGSGKTRTLTFRVAPPKTRALNRTQMRNSTI